MFQGTDVLYRKSIAYWLNEACDFVIVFEHDARVTFGEIDAKNLLTSSWVWQVIMRPALQQPWLDDEDENSEK